MSPTISRLIPREPRHSPELHVRRGQRRPLLDGPPFQCLPCPLVERRRTRVGNGREKGPQVRCVLVGRVPGPHPREEAHQVRGIRQLLGVGQGEQRHDECHE